MSAVCRYDEASGSVYYECPGCKHAHSVPAQRWNWNGSLDKPTLSPSVKHFIPGSHTRSGADETTCHYFIKDGKIDYCSDSPHDLAGKCVDLPVLTSESEL